MLLIGIFTLLGFIIVLGFLSNFFFKTTGIPDIILLLFLGLLLGPILNFVDPFIFEDFSQAFSALALMILLFESGLNLKLYKVFKESPRAILLAVVGIILTMSITFLFARFLLGWDLLPGLLLGAIVGGSSSSIVAPLMRKVNASNNIATLLTLESTFTDALTVIIAIGVIQLLMQPAMNTFYSIS
ncbi:MAG: peptidase, partial [Candidatus Aenigmarchaeota archaeon CG_4_10_14_3_um_filter_37_21]